MTSEQAIILEAKGLRKAFGGLVAVDDVDIRIREFTLHYIIGPNGAGKTTLFNLLSGVMPPTRGKVFFQRGRYHPFASASYGPYRIGTFLPDHQYFPQPDCIGKCASAAQAMGHDNFKLFRAAGSF